MERSPMDGGNGSTWGLHLFTYCCILPQPSLAYVNKPKKDLFVAKVHPRELVGYMTKREHRQARQKGKLRGSIHRTYFLSLSIGSGTSPTPHTMVILPFLKMRISTEGALHVRATSCTPAVFILCKLCYLSVTSQFNVHTGSSSWSSPNFSSSKNPPPVSMNLLPWTLITLFSTESAVFLENKCNSETFISALFVHWQSMRGISNQALYHTGQPTYDCTWPKGVLFCAQYHEQQQSQRLTVHVLLPLSTFCLQLSPTV